MNKSNIENCCIIDALCGIDTSSPHITQYTDSFDTIKFVFEKNMNDYTFMLITDIDGYVSIVPTDGEKLIKDTDESNNTVLWWNMGKEITASSGVVIYQISAYLQKDGETKSVWYSKEGRLFVSESIDCATFSANLAGSNPDLITKLILQTRELSDILDKNSQKLAGIEEGSQKNVQSDWEEADEKSDGYIKNKPDLKELENRLQEEIGIVNDVALNAEASADANGTDLNAHRNNGDADRMHLTDEEKVSVGKIGDVNRLPTLDKSNIVSSIAEVVRYVSNNSNSIDDIFEYLEKKAATKEELRPTPITVVPTTLAANKAYNFGSIQGSLTLSFPRLANDGDVIYIGFIAREGMNLVVDTTNTFDFDLIPETDTGYEIYAKCTTNIGVTRWIVKYSEYTGV